MSKADKRIYTEAVLAASQKKCDRLVKTMTSAAQKKVEKTDKESLYLSFAPRSTRGCSTSAPAESAMHQLKTAQVRSRNIYQSLVNVVQLRCRLYDERRREFMKFTTADSTKNETIVPYALKALEKLKNEIIERPLTVVSPTAAQIQSAGTSTLTKVLLIPFVNKDKGQITVTLCAHGPINLRQPVLNATCSRHSKMDGNSSSNKE
tara:strand:- start:1303 stop:1920 length:618 start_codon:yes stop_codon:yes gene_type:complete